MNPAVVAAIIAAIASFVTLIGTVAAQIFGFHITRTSTQETIKAASKDTEKTIKGTHEDTAATLAGQGEQLAKTLADSSTLGR